MRAPPVKLSGMALRIAIIALLAFFTPLPAAGAAHAAPASPLIFRDKARDAREESVIAALAASNHILADLPYQIAAIDLNHDGADEWIVRQDRMSACEAAAACRYYIVGISKNRPLVIGSIEAGKIVVSREKLYGISVLYVYDDPGNDFEFRRYRWNPQRSAYAP